MTFGARPFALAVILPALLAACAASPPAPQYTAQDIQAAASGGSLEAFYDQVAADLRAPKLKDDERAALEATLEEVGGRLAQTSSAEIEAALGGSRLESSLVPLKAYAAQQSQLARVQGWHAATYQKLASKLAAGEQETRKAIAQKTAAVEALSAEQLAERLAAYIELGALHGAGSEAASEYEQKSEQLVVSLRVEAQKAVAQEEYSDAQRMLAAVAALAPSDEGIQSELLEVDVKLFEQRFYSALEQDRPEDAYEAFITLSESENWAVVRPRLADSADVMADYFVALGAGATEEGNLTSAYRWFSQARHIRERLGQGNDVKVREEEPFVAELHRRFELARAQDLEGLAWGYLTVINEMQPGTPSLRRDLRETRELVLTQAIKRLSASAFQDSHEGADFGDAVTAKVVQYLFENLPDDVRIIERAELDLIRQEHSLSEGEEKLRAVDYLLQGNILEAKVDSKESSGTKTLRVVTGQETVPNPEWDRWHQMSSKERKRAGLTQPTSATMTVEKKEDVAIDVTHHRKVGIFAVSYRVIDAQSAKVLFADTERLSREHEDTSSDGVDLGQFQQEFKVADLPSDVEILTDLADAMSEKIGSQLAAVFAEPEAQYADAGARFVREGNYVDASQQYAYAVVLADRKDEDAEDLRKSLQTAAVAAAIGSDGR